jgi:hypothetical protein
MLWDWLLNNGSREVCHRITGNNESLCSLAYRTRHRFLSRVLLRIVGEKHARESHEFYNAGSRTDRKLG